MNLPEVAKPTQKRLSFREKLKWTIIILILFFVLGTIPLFGLGENALRQFTFLSIIFAAKFGSIISLGIGPIVTASIVLQLLNGSGLLKFDLTTHEGKKMFQGVQKLAAIFFILFEAIVFVFLGGLSPASGMSPLILVFQLFLGGILILFMDEVVSKWGFGSGISLFIAAGVSEEIFVRLLSTFTLLETSKSVLGFPFGSAAPSGKLWVLLFNLSGGDPRAALLPIGAILATAAVFALAVYAQAMKIEVPLSFGRVRGHGIRWPLSFIYTSNIPVILVASLLATIQLWARLLQNAAQDSTSRILNFFSVYIMGQIDTAQAGYGLIQWVTPPNLLEAVIKGSLTSSQIVHALGFVLLMIAGSIMFSVFWVQTAGMDARSLSKQMMSSGLQIPGFRRDERVLESLLNRYIPSLTVLGAITVGFLASVADLSGTLTSGTGLLLTVMIIYRLYEEIAQQHAMDMYPMMRRFMGG